MLKIYGCSDDLVEVEGILDEEIGCYDNAVEFTISDDNGGIRVLVSYDNFGDGCWSFKVTNLADGLPLPFPVRFENEHDYSLALVVDCGFDACVDFELR